MMERVLLIHEKVKDAALVEEYIEGREFYVGSLGNTAPQAFPPMEMDFLRDAGRRAADPGCQGEVARA